MGPKELAKLQAKWEKKLAAEGLAPLTTYSDGARTHRRLVEKVASTSAGQRRAVERYYSRAEKFLRRIELAHGIWALHCTGLGRREIASRLQLREKIVRVVLEKCSTLAGL